MGRISKKIIYLIALSFLFACHTTKVIAPQQNFFSQKIEIASFENLYNVDDHLYRSEQPDSKGWIELNNLGIGTVLNLRNWKSDMMVENNTGMEFIHFPIKAGAISYEEVKEALKIIIKTQKKVLVHCKHGSDRTGCIVAVYRMVVNGWTREKSINEFLDPRFGYHEKWFPNILKLLKKLDIEKLKKELELSK